MKITNARELEVAVRFERITWEQVFKGEFPDVEPIKTHRKGCHCTIGPLEECGDGKDVDCYKCQCELCVPEWMFVGKFVVHGGEISIVKAIDKKSGKRYIFEHMAIQLHKQGGRLIEVPATSVKETEIIPLGDTYNTPELICNGSEYYVLSSFKNGYYHEGDFCSFQQVMDNVPREKWAAYREKK